MYSKKVACVGYIDDSIVAQQGQAAALAEFPVWIHSQRNHLTKDVPLKNAVRGLNPDIKLITYIEMTQRNITSGTGPGGGPGYDVLRGGVLGDTAAIAARAKDLCVEVGGSLLIAAGQYRYDWRKPAMQEAGLSAIAACYAAYPEEGIIIDNANVWNDAHPDQLVREEMYQARQRAYFDMAAAFPDKILLLNTDRPYRGANGEMCENRLTSWTTELPEHVGQKQPRFDIGVWTTPTSTPTDAQIQAQMQIAHDRGAYFYWCQNYQHAQGRAFYA